MIQCFPHNYFLMSILHSFTVQSSVLLYYFQGQQQQLTPVLSQMNSSFSEETSSSITKCLQSSVIVSLKLWLYKERKSNWVLSYSLKSKINHKFFMLIAWKKVNSGSSYSGNTNFKHVLKFHWTQWNLSSCLKLSSCLGFLNRGLSQHFFF